MTFVSSPRVFSPTSSPTSSSSAPPPTRQTFVRNPQNMSTAAAGAVSRNDGAQISPVALARELDAQFPEMGQYHFVYDGKPCVVQRFDNGSMHVADRGNRFVEIENGVITHEHVLQGDLSAFLLAARRGE